MTTQVRVRTRMPSLSRRFGWLVLGTFAVSMIVPFAWTLSTSFQARESLLRIPPELIPQDPSFDSYRRLTEVMPFGRILLNSAIVAVVITSLQVVTSAMAGYGYHTR